MEEKEIICIGCPMGCRVKVTADRGGIISFNGNKCKDGEELVAKEFKSPRRILTATVLAEGSRQALLPVRSSMPISKDKIREAISFLATVRIKPPVNMEQLIIPNILETGADIIATKALVE
jgi:CxxC motif-containing protein